MDGIMRGGLRAFLATGLIMTTVLSGSVLTASAADDGGLQSFFRQQFGIQFDQAPSGGDFNYDAPFDDRPLVVRPRHRPAPRQQVVVVGPVAPVSIYEDKTLRRGDAVMTAKGIRIFNGARSTPYRDSDFVAVADAGGISKRIEKALAAIDRLPRS